MQTKSGKPIHPIGIGTWGISSFNNPLTQGSKYRGVEPKLGSEESEIEAIKYSLSLGQNHLDCAEMYGGFYTDEVVGRALNGAKREDLFIADKLWKHSVAKGQVRPTVEKMFDKLGTDYLDLLYIHAPWPEFPWQQAIPQIDELIDEGLVSNFGVSNFGVVHMEPTLAIAKHPIAVNQMNYNVLYKDEVDDEFRKFCDEHEIKVVAYQPIKRGAVIHNDTILKIARAHDATQAQIALAWLLAQNTLPIPKATQKSHIDENLGALKITLNQEELQTLNSL